MSSLTAPATSSIGYAEIDAVLVEQVDAIRLQALERPLCYFLDMRWTTIRPTRALD